MPTPDPTILFVKPQAIIAEDKEALRLAGVIVVEVEDIANIKLVRASAELTGSELLICATAALIKSGESTNAYLAQFAAAICKKLQVKAPQ